mgnify:CR=1 FL=1
MKGCKSCPAYAKCTATYRGSVCAALRSSYGIDEDPEVYTNADYIRAMSDKQMAIELIPLLMDVCEDGVPGEDYFLHWLQSPVEQDKED